MPWNKSLLLFLMLGACHPATVPEKKKMANVWDSISGGWPLNQHQIAFLGLNHYYPSVQPVVKGEKSYQLGPNVMVAILQVKGADCEEKMLVTYNLQEGKVKAVQLLDQQCNPGLNSAGKVKTSYFLNDSCFTIESSLYEKGDTNLLHPVVGVGGGCILSDGTVL